MVDASRAEADVENGVVRIRIPKTEEEKPKRIEVKKKVK
jgi:HSP20 family molecular chaperone IbpA